MQEKIPFFLQTQSLGRSRFSKHPKGALREHFSHSALVQVDAAQPGPGGVLRTASVSRQTKPKPVCHSPRFHSRPATFTSLRSLPFTVPSVFVRWRSSRSE